MNKIFEPCSFELLNTIECNHFVSKIDKLNALWGQEKGARFNTLGKPAYQHSNDIYSYFELNRQINKFLLLEFSELYQTLLNFFRAKLDLELDFTHQFALPGFHIFSLNSDDGELGGGIHRDQSHQQLFEHIGYPRHSSINISYTLPLELPTGVCGLEYWPGNVGDSYDPFVFGVASNTQAPDFHRYRLGFLSVFSGNLDHRIAPNKHVKGFGRRITLQGHIVEFDDRIITFW